MNEFNRHTVTPDDFKDGKKKTIAEKLKKFEEENRLRTKFGDFFDIEKYFKGLLERGEIKQIESLRKYLKENVNKVKEKNLIENDEAIRAIIDGDVKLVWENDQLKVEIVQKELTPKEKKKQEKKNQEVKEQLDIIATVSGAKRNENFFSGNTGQS